MISQIYCIGFIAPVTISNRIIPNIHMMEKISYTSLIGKHISSALITSQQVISYDVDGNVFSTSIIPYQIPSVTDKLVENGVDIFMNNQQSLIDTFFQNFPFILFMVFALSTIGRNGQMNAMNIVKKSKELEERPTTKFSDIAGCEESKFELQEVVEFLKTPEKYKDIGAKIPKGVVMEGPPGTGKTLLARAVAAEADVPFFSVSASEFVEMYVGLGASRVRDLFSRAKKKQPSIVFIDELDAIGKKRSQGQNGIGGNEEREQTLNQILSEIDGFDKEVSVVVLAATNRIDMLDSALLRPGRFDRKVPVTLPDVKGRIDIINLYLKDKPIENDIDIDSISQLTSGFSGAELSNLINEASICTIRRNATSISQSDILNSIDRITIGFKRKTIMPEKIKRLVAYHEGGHAIVGTLLDDFEDVIQTVTIVPRSNGAGGFTRFIPSNVNEFGLYSKKYLKAQLAVIMGGKAAEKLIYGEDEVTVGASSDIQQATNLAKNMIQKWGFGKSVFSKENVEEEASDLVDEALETAYSLLASHQILLEKMADILVKKETIQKSEVQELIGRELGLIH